MCSITSLYDSKSPAAEINSVLVFCGEPVWAICDVILSRVKLKIVWIPLNKGRIETFLLKWTLKVPVIGRVYSAGCRIMFLWCSEGNQLFGHASPLGEGWRRLGDPGPSGPRPLVPCLLDNLALWLCAIHGHIFYNIHQNQLLDVSILQII